MGNKIISGVYAAPEENADFRSMEYPQIVNASGVKVNLLAGGLEYMIKHFNDQSTISEASMENAQLKPRLQFIYGEPEATTVNGTFALKYQIAQSDGIRVPTNMFLLRGERTYSFAYAMVYDRELEDRLFYIVSNGSSGIAAYSFSDGSMSGESFNQQQETRILYKKDGLIVWGTTILDPDTGHGGYQRVGVSTSPTVETEVIIYNLIASENPVDIYSEYRTLPQMNHSQLIGKNVMVFGDSNIRGGLATALMQQLGCSVYRNDGSDRTMAFRWNNRNLEDFRWLYYWDRRKYIADCIENGLEFPAFLFYASYSDVGGGELSDAAIRRVYDHYPVLGDDESTVERKLAVFNSLTTSQREAIFGYKQTFAAYLKQLIELAPASSIYLSTLLYCPDTYEEGDPDYFRMMGKKRIDTVNENIREIAAWFGIPVIDNNAAATYYFGNMRQQGTTELKYTGENVAYRVGYHTAKEICKHMHRDIYELY